MQSQSLILRSPIAPRSFDQMVIADPDPIAKKRSPIAHALSAGYYQICCRSYFLITTILTILIDIKSDLNWLISCYRIASKETIRMNKYSFIILFPKHQWTLWYKLKLRKLIFVLITNYFRILLWKQPCSGILYIVIILIWLKNILKILKFDFQFWKGSNKSQWILSSVLNKT